MINLEYRVSFASPAFLGNAEQLAQWRTPPFKAMLRQWWRVATAASLKTPYSIEQLRAREMHLFGAAGEDGKGAGRSRLTLRLASWQTGELPSIPPGQPVDHDEVPGKKVGANLYLGYGPIGGTARSAIAPHTFANTLRLRCPAEHRDEIHAALQLAAWFGTLGSRSRNGWGALHIEGEGLKGFGGLNSDTLKSITTPRALQDCLGEEWLHAIGADASGTPLVWRLLKADRSTTPPQRTAFDAWQAVMHELARIRIAVRTDPFFKFEGGGRSGHVQPQPRHILAYPAGSSHSVSAWGNDARLANQLLFKVHRHGKGFAATLAHFPSRLPRHLAQAFTPAQLPDQREVWETVHRLLDQQRSKGLVRIKEAQS